MDHVTCRSCGALREPNDINFYCHRCDSFFEFQLEFSISSSDLVRLCQDNFGIWNFRQFLPPLPHYITYQEGNTPFLRPRKLFSNELAVYFKDESRNPSGTFRDRCACLMACHAKSISKKSVICGTSGNHGVSMLTYGLPLDLNVTCITPLLARLHKITQIKALGGEIITHGTNLSESIEKAKMLSKRLHYYDATPENNYLTIQGQKTIAYETVAQLTRRNIEVNASTVVFVPLGAGLILLSLYQGFKDLLELKIIDEMPRLVGVGLDEARTMQQSERVFVPPELLPLTGQSPLESEIERALVDTDGFILSLNEESFLEQSYNVARYEGIIVEPASASVIAGIQECLKLRKINVNDTIIAILTSTGSAGKEFYRSSLDLSAFNKRKRNPFLTKYLILDFLARHGPHNGYQIWKHVNNLVPCRFQAIYQHLKELNQMKVIAPYQQPKNNNERRKTFWLLTGLGFEYLESLTTILMIESETGGEPGDS